MIMTRIRPKRQWTVGFEALEGRLALSTGTAVASPHLHDAVVRASQTKVPASFRGIVSVNNGSTLTTTNLQGTIGRDHFTGYGTGTEAGKQFQGGDVYLSNGQGSIHLGLSPTYAVRKGKTSTRTFAITVVSADGKYAPYSAATGTITKWNVPDKSNAIARFSAIFTL
jgi:hypothetical protein